ncbi:hypothetical protein [Formosa sp. 4Alg 33]|uniref:hypothetical protein n=1 Tax=Formosa sp. 4Alg 33 TaxID=3382189 RepID=UPI003D9C056E
MNKLILTLAISLSLISFNGFEFNSEFKLVGEWEGTDKDEVGYFTFDKEGYAYIKFGTDLLGGKEFVKDGKKFSLTYKVDYKKSPITVDLIFTELETERQLVWPCIIDVLENDRIMFARGSNGIRPENFTDYDFIILNRIK